MTRTLLATTAVLLVLAPSAQAKPEVVSAIAYFQPTHGNLRELQRGNLRITFRTDRPLGRKAFEQGIAMDGSFGYVHRISRSERCYGGMVHVDPKAKVPGRVRVRLGNRGRLFDALLDVKKMRRNYINGAPLGCGADRRTRVHMFNLFETPMWAPRQIFFTANAGPYVEDLGWRGWGSERAVGRGVYVSTCASCGGPETRPAKLIFTNSVRCGEYGGRVYRSGILETRTDTNKKKRTRIYTGYPC
jgi:hypothetical protein